MGFRSKPILLSNDRLGSWSCENALAEALTPRDLDEAAVLDDFAAFSVWKCS